MKPDEDFEDDRKIDDISSRNVIIDQFSEAFLTVVGILNSTFSSIEADRAFAKRAIEILSYFALNGLNFLCPVYAARLYLFVTEKFVNAIVDCGAVPALVRRLIAPVRCRQKMETLLNHTSSRLRKEVPTRLDFLLLKRAADAITNLAHENRSIQSLVRVEDGIPPLVELLGFIDTKVQIAAAGALRSLAFENDENKNQIVECIL